ncbi:MAG: undecaprenyldiphospho-muramoylpentapeptide beta-N-acetylglucosaminyltransferase [Myxococcales bacterium]|nr:MAG: undecaprenyldiphospho-muramoylpentapeptide beta-N-acetylglucosaminyltransferase [Myxococcales bacterium]
MIERLVVAGGGTGGHLFPGIAVVEELRRRSPGIEVIFVGTKRGIEHRLLPQRGERLEYVEVESLKGRSLLGFAASLTRLPRSLWRAFRLLRSIKPSVVLGVGGYASGPVVFVAALMGIPTALLEQNAHVGLTNRLLGKVVKRAYLSFQSTAAIFGKRKARVLGNPVRREFVDAARLAKADPQGFRSARHKIVVFGGSQGAKALNEQLPEAMALLKKEHGIDDLCVVHQSGQSMQAQVQEHYNALGIEAEVLPFVENVLRQYREASVIVARAGATTVAELCAVGRASVLVPYPFAADDHQNVNAKELEQVGAAERIEQSSLDAGVLASEASAPTKRHRVPGKHGKRSPRFRKTRRRSSHRR